MTRVTALPEMMKRAVAAYQRGRLGEADDLARAILSVKADYFDALHLLAVISTQQRRFDEALASYDRALALRPDHAEALCNRGATLHELQRFDEALASYDRALALRPDYAGAVLYNRGNALRQLQRFGEALASYDRALALQPDHAEALCNRGIALHELKRFDEALASYDRALALRPDYAGALYNRGNALRQMKRLDEALASYDRALAARPDDADALNNRGNTLHELKRFDEALASYDRALTLQPDHAEALYNRGDALHERGDLHAALAHYRRALSLKPELADVYNNVGNVLKELGQLQEAQSAYREALRLDPNSTAVYFNLADAKTFKPGDAHLVAMAALAAKTEGLSTTDRMRLDFALGKAYADLNDHSRSFQHLRAGNAAKRASISYDEAAALGLFDRIAAVFTPELIAAKSGGGDPSALPIFVLGMPRSGTTLVEQIIASHPAVHGAGELQLLSDVVRSVSGPDGKSLFYPEFVAALDAGALHQIGTRYAAMLRELAADHGAPSAERVTNKTPSNYYCAGLIHLALPNAKIIHTIRDPLDTCMSCFSKLFTEEQNHTYDLGELGRYYRRYERLMAHWRRVLPVGRILEVRYEDVVADLERQARRIIAYCGLPWDERCLSFHETDRPVRTASATQVRQPIYTSAIGRWRAYAEHIAPLLNGLGVTAVEAISSPSVLAPPDVGEAMKRAVAAYQRGRLGEADRLARAILDSKLDHFDALYLTAVISAEQRRFDEALASYDRALALRPDYTEALYNRGTTLHELQRFDEALASYDRALALRPDHAKALNNRGNALQQKQRLDEALASYDRALELQPDYAQAHFNRSLLQLLKGNFDAGWREYEWRWKDASLKLPNRDFDQPLWLGDTAIEGETILLHSEQALGDTIQFCRYVPLVAGRGARVLLEVPAPLKDLMASLVGVAQVISAPDQPAHFDLHCPLLSLPLAFGTRIESIPAHVPYLTAPSESLRRWNVMLGSKRRLRIGLAWSGQPWPANRSIELRSLLPLLDLNADFVSLQKDVRAGDATVLQERSDLVPLGDKLDTFADTAAVIANLDLVISVDTSVAHLAGALAKPVWLLLPFLPDFRWLLDREDSPWYPTARLFRQNAPGDWSGVISRVVVELEKLLQAYDERASASRVTTLPEVMKRAVAAYEGGRLREADDLARAILGVKPDYFDALHLIAVISTRQRRLDEALASYDRALALRPDHAEALCNRGATLHALQRFDEALASCDRALALQPDHAGAFYNRGMTLHELKRFDEALASYDRALALQPDHAGAFYNRGMTLHELKRFDEALASYDRALALQPDHAEALFNRGNALRQLKRFDEALASYDRALALRPDYAEALNNRGNALRQMKRLDEALASYDRALAARPNYVEALNNRGNTLHELKRFDEALASYDRALTLQPDHAEALYSRGNTLHERDDLHAALAHYRRALSLKPELADAYNNMGNVLKELGQLQEAQNAYREALRLDPNSTAVYFNLADAKTFKPGDAHLAAMAALAAKTEGLSTTDRMRLDFALGKAYADLNDHSRSFQHLRAGNAAKRASISYDEAAALGLFDRIEAVFTPELIAAKSGGGDPSALPIFVLGMPRSGTTLVEQIIASHPAVHGAGELQLLSDVVRSVSGPDGKSLFYPEFVAALDAGALHQIGTRYAAMLRELAADHGAPSAERVTNKTPSNYYCAGLIHLALPNAKIIHTIRDPLDTCMSCFSKLFTEEQNHTYDLGELGRYYRRYERLMAHWRRVLPVGRILEVRYEDVVADLERQARRIIAYCGLPWDERCLSFHETDRPVRTASATQVRQPIYTSAIGRWRAYAEHIAPLLNGLGVTAVEAISQATEAE